MNNDIKELMSGILKDMSALNYIKPGDVPNINLYMDQVTTFMYEHLHDTKRTTDDKVLTKTMINNYAKNNLLPSPVKKKYSKEHIYILTFIYYFKNFLSINEEHIEKRPYSCVHCPARAAGLAGTGLRGLRAPHQQSFRLCDAG